MDTKDFTYLLSCDVNLDVTIKVRSLDLDGCANNVSKELYVTAQLFCGGYDMAVVSQCTHRGACSSNDDNKVTWGEWLGLPVRYSDLQLNACVLLSVWDATGRFGVGVVYLFDELGRLRRGRVQLSLHQDIESLQVFLKRWDSKDMLHVDGEVGGEERTRMWEVGEKYNHEEVQKLGWLDELARKRARDIISANRFLSTKVSNGVLTVEFPYFEFPVVFEERAYYSERMDAIFLLRSQEEQHERERSASRFSRGSGGSASTDSHKNHHAGFTWENHLCVVHDPQMMHVQGRAMDVKEILNPVEEKYRRLNPSMVRGVVDKFLKPNKDERNQIQQIVHSSGKLNRKHQDLLWKFCYSLASDKKALIKFVMSVDWDSPVEVKQAEELLNEWAQIDIADALRLLGEEPEFCNNVVRAHAIKILDKASDSELLLYLLQLVQALRYDDIYTTEVPTQDEEAGENKTSEWHPGPLASFLIRRAVNSESLVSFFTWYLSIEVENKESGLLFGNIHRELLLRLRKSPRGRGLAAQLTEQTNFVKKIMMMGKEGRGRALTRQNYLQRMLRQSDGKYHELCDLHVPVMHPLWPWRRVVAVNPDSVKVFTSKTQPIKLDLVLAPKDETNGTRELSPVMFKVGDDLRQDQLVLQLLGVMDKMFKDVNLDLHLTLYRVLAFANDEGVVEFVQNSSPLSQIQKNHGTITSFFRLQAKVQYQVEHEAARKKIAAQQQQATQQSSASAQSATSGDVESSTSSSTSKAHRKGKATALSRSENEIYDEIVSKFIKSCAGYAMCTYVLCVGDRHLDNIMIRSTGELFHIDFGYIFGNDPRSWAVNQVRLTSSMIAAMGGRGSPGFDKFISHCVQAYMVLRKNSSLILNLIHLMKDSRIENLFDDHEAVIQIVRDRFELDRSDENAEIWLIEKLNKFEDTFVTTISDKLHDVNVMFN